LPAVAPPGILRVATGQARNVAGGAAMDVFWQELRRLAELYAGRILGTAAILAVGFVALRYLVAPLRRLLERSRIEPSTTSFLANSLRGLLIVVVIIAVLQQLGVETTSLLTV